MKEIVFVVLFTSLLVSCVSMKEGAESYLYAPFVSPDSIIKSVGQNNAYLQSISRLMNDKNLFMVDDYSSCDYYLIVSFSYDEIPKGNYSFKRAYDYVHKTTSWTQPSGETKRILTLTLILYDALDLRVDGLYSVIKEVQSSVDISNEELYLHDETIIETHLPTLLRKLEKEW